MAENRQLRLGGFYALSIAISCAGMPFSAGAENSPEWAPQPSPEWARQLGISYETSSNGVAADSDGNVYISGIAVDAPGSANGGDWDAWVAKYTASGELLWTRRLGTSALEQSRAVATDAHGNVYISGETYGPLAGRNQGEQIYG